MPKPKPFNRPTVEISTGAKREWQHLPIEEVAVRDMVAEFGEVDVKQFHGEDILIVSTLSRVERLPKGTKVHVYAYPPKGS